VYGEDKNPHNEIEFKSLSPGAYFYLEGISERYKANESEKQAT
jgi:hypothetical protein